MGVEQCGIGDCGDHAPAAILDRHVDIGAGVGDAHDARAVDTGRCRPGDQRIARVVAAQDRAECDRAPRLRQPKRNIQRNAARAPPDLPGEVVALAEEVGRELARAGAVIVCGGLGGVMEAACRGAKEEGGRTLGILPGRDRVGANPHLDLSVVTGMSEARNALIARTADALVALPGGHGTLSEIALGLKMGRRVVGLRAWSDVGGVISVEDPAEAVCLALEAIPPSAG